MANRKWLAERIQTQYLPFLRSVKDTSAGHRKLEQFTQELRQGWTDQGLRSLKQQQGCMDQIRRSIKDALGEDHFSLDYIAFSTEEYTALNDQKQRSVAERNEDVKYIDNPEGITAKAVRLLESQEWADVAAGLAVLTGRRVSELLSTATFEKKTKWSVLFAGALKRRGEPTPISFEIPTLATADRVCKALAKIRKQLPDAQSMSADEINQKFSDKVAAACDRHFQGLVPPRAGGNLYTHLFRAVYATISTFWYCPPHVDPVEFRAAIQGHYQVLDAKDPALKRSLAASRHYADFDIADSVIAEHQGKRKGIKLGVAGIEPIEIFQQSPSTLTVLPAKPRRTIGSLRYPAQDHDRWMEILHAIAPLAKTQAERMTLLLDWIEAQHQQKPIEEVSETPMSAIAEVSEPETPEPQPEEASPKLDPTVALLVEQMALVMQSVSKLTDAIVVERNSPATTQQATAPAELKTPRQPNPQKSVPSETSKPPQTYKPRGDSHDIIKRAIDAIVAYNNTPDRTHDDKWAITINGLKEFANSQHVIQSVLQQRHDEISTHHEQHQIDPKKHNFRHRGKRKITDMITI